MARPGVVALAALLLAGTLTGTGTAQEADPYPRVASYELELTFAPAESGLQGTAVIRLADARSRDEVVCFLHGELRVEEVSSGESALSFTQERVFYPDDYSLVATRVVISTRGALLEDPLRIVYTGKVQPSAARSPSDYMRIDEDEVLLRAYGYSLWFPVFLPSDRDWYDADFRVTVRTPAELVSVFAGELLERGEQDGSAVSRWFAPDLSLINAQLSARPWVVTRRGDKFAYSEPDMESRARAEGILEYLEDLEERFREWYRPDASSTQWHILQMPRYGDISSGNVVGLTNGIWADFESDVNAKRALAHEVVHPFVRPEISRNDPLFSFVIEGFPSYLHLPAFAELEGEDEYERFIRWMEELYLDKRKTGKGWRGRPLPREKPLLEIRADELSTYKDTFVLDDRALLFFDYLRRRLGPDGFFGLTRELFRQQELTSRSFEATVIRHLSDGGDAVRLWLHTSAYPQELRIPPREGGSVSAGETKIDRTR